MTGSDAGRCRRWASLRSIRGVGAGVAGDDDDLEGGAGRVPRRRESAPLWSPRRAE